MWPFDDELEGRGLTSSPFCREKQRLGRARRAVATFAWTCVGGTRPSCRHDRLPTAGEIAGFGGDNRIELRLDLHRCSVLARVSPTGGVAFAQRNLNTSALPRGVETRRGELG